MRYMIVMYAVGAGAGSKLTRALRAIVIIYSSMGYAFCFGRRRAGDGLPASCVG